MSESAVRGTYGFSSLSEKTRKSNRLQMSLQRQHFLLSYLRCFRHNFSEAIPIFFNGFKSDSVLVQTPEFFTSDWILMEVCQNAVLSKNRYHYDNNKQKTLNRSNFVRSRPATDRKSDSGNLKCAI